MTEIIQLDAAQAAETLRDIADRIESGDITASAIGIMDGNRVRASLYGQYLPLIGVNELVRDELLRRLRNE